MPLTSAHIESETVGRQGRGGMLEENSQGCSDSRGVCPGSLCLFSLVLPAASAQGLSAVFLLRVAPTNYEAQRHLQT